jgi:hypothetical protein
VTRFFPQNCLSCRVLGLKRSIARDYKQVSVSLASIEGTVASGMIRSNQPFRLILASRPDGYLQLT